MGGSGWIRVADSISTDSDLVSFCHWSFHHEGQRHAERVRLRSHSLGMKGRTILAVGQLGEGGMRASRLGESRLLAN